MITLDRLKEIVAEITPEASPDHGLSVAVEVSPVGRGMLQVMLSYKDFGGVFFSPEFAGSEDTVRKEVAATLRMMATRASQVLAPKPQVSDAAPSGIVLAS